MIKQIFELQNPWRSSSDYIFKQKPRDILDTLIRNLDNDKMLGLIGSRQVGKSSIIYLLIKHLIKDKKIAPFNILYFNLDDLKLHELFRNIPQFVQFIGKGAETNYIFIDEIQRLALPGLFLKEIFDLNLNYKIIFSGSSQLEIKAKTKEHLVGRARFFEINRLSLSEYINFNRPVTKTEALHEALIYGMYPEVVLSENYQEKKLILKDIYQSYIEKDITQILNIENIEAFNKLLTILALQNGNLLNIDNLARHVKISRKQIEHYIHVLEATFIVKRLFPFYKSHKKEITKTPKLYFLDTGLCNYALNNFNQIELRNDLGSLFENFYYLELIKNDFYGMKKMNFWRTTNQTEIDFIVQSENLLEAIEVKWMQKSLPKSFKSIQKIYPHISTKLVTSEDFTDTIL